MKADYSAQQVTYSTDTGDDKMAEITGAEHEGRVGFEDALAKSGLTNLTDKQKKAAEAFYDTLQAPNNLKNKEYYEKAERQMAEFKTALLAGKSGDAVGDTFMKMARFNQLSGVSYTSL